MPTVIGCLPLQDSLRNRYKDQLLSYSLEEVKNFTQEIFHVGEYYLINLCNDYTRGGCYKARV